MMVAPKPGIRTTEFWLSAIVIVLGALAQVLGLVLPSDHVAIQAIGIASGMIAQVGAILGYQSSRAKVKAGA